MTKQKKDKSISDSFEELDKIVADFENEELDLDKSVEKFKQAVDLAKQLKKRLTNIETQIEEIDLDDLKS